MDDYWKNRQAGLRGQGPKLGARKIFIGRPAGIASSGMIITKEEQRPRYTKKGFRGHEHKQYQYTFNYPATMSNHARHADRKANRNSDDTNA